MKKKIGIFIVIIFSAVIVFSLYYIKILSKSDLPESMLQKSFDYSGAKIVNSEIYFWTGTQKFISEDTFEKFSKDLQKEMGVLGDSSLTRRVTENENLYKIDINGSTRDRRIFNLSYHKEKMQGTNGNGYLSLRITEDLTSLGLEVVRSKALEIFKKYGVSPRINSCITGYYDGMLAYNQLNEICRRVFYKADAKKVEGIRSDKLISVSAYTPSIVDYIKVNNKKVNLNLAIRYNSFENKTYIWLATPVITTEY